MDEQKKKQIVIGILAHVDAGKTTLSEGLLFKSGVINAAGRVDHGDSHLDTDEIERKRGITVYSAQAKLWANNTEITLLDTPGHADFLAETERVLPVLDYAILLISAAEGVQSHTKTLMKLLAAYDIPMFVFFNKMDIAQKSREELITEMEEAFGDGFVSFDREMDEAWLEDIALLDEDLMECFLSLGSIPFEKIAGRIKERRLFPCYFGSALKLLGLSGIIKGLDLFTLQPVFGDEFAARVFKISSDEKGNRLTHMRITGGSLSVRQSLSGDILPQAEEDTGESEEKGRWSQKVSEIRACRGDRFEAVSTALAGEVVCVPGLSYTHSGGGLGADEGEVHPMIAPVLSYQMKFVGNVDAAGAFRRIGVLCDELPELSMRWDPAAKAIFVNLMGTVQTEILAQVLHDRFGYVVEFGRGRISYRETISNCVEGVGHFEPLRHYAEVHLRLEPGERGSGLSFDTDCPEDVLARNWQRLILTHLKEKQHKGVLTGSPVTDIKISVISGRAHPKHTMGGDFRQATYRAVRQGLKKAESQLLEPYYRFSLEIPASVIGRAMTDLDGMFAKCEPPETDGESAVLKGIAPVSTLHEYAGEVAAFTGGEGRLSLSVAGYFPCHNADEVIEERAYDSEADLYNPTGSVFCAHGAGFLVPWDQVEDYMHMEAALYAGETDGREYVMPVAIPKGAKATSYGGSIEEDNELSAIFEREFGRKNPKKRREARRIEAPKPDSFPAPQRIKKKKKSGKKYLLVDGYNVIHAWKELKELADIDLSAARGRLSDLLCNYQGFTSLETILVFDAYKVKGGQGSVEKYNNIYIIYTKEAETADAYIEKATHDIAKEHDVVVVSSDGLVQLIVLGAGAVRMSSAELYEEMQRVGEEYL